MPPPALMVLGTASHVVNEAHAAGLLACSAGEYTVRLLPPLIATLGSFFAIGGVITVYTGGANLFGFPDAFNALGQGHLFGIPYLIYYAVVIGIIFHLLLERTVFGYETRITGGNRQAASASG